MSKQERRAKLASAFAPAIAPALHAQLASKTPRSAASQRPAGFVGAMSRRDGPTKWARAILKPCGFILCARFANQMGGRARRRDEGPLWWAARASLATAGPHPERPI